MDIKDKKLIYLLDLNSRSKEIELARQLKTSKQVINYRIKRLESEKIIKKFQTVINLDSLGIGIYTNVYFKILGASKAKEEEIINFLINNNNVGYIALLGGRFDLSIVLVAKNIQQLEENLNSIINRYSEELREHMVSLRTFGVKFPKKYLLVRKVEAKRIFTKERNLEKIDNLDKQILQILSQNSRLSIVDISNKLKIPFSTIRARIKSLESRNVIAGYSILPDLNKLGMLNYKLFIKLRNKSEDSYKKLLSFSEAHKNIIWVFKTLGEHDCELRIEAESQEKYQEIIKEIRSHFSQIIEETETVIVFNELKEDYSVILENIKI
ncbi:MAG: Lrp/AsnC family transcriptional regulator [Nanoarchaeota archaeon]